jgi:hypothetical protein
MFSFFTIIISFCRLEKNVLFFADEIVFVFANSNKRYQTLVRFLALLSKITNVGRKSVILSFKLEKNETVFIKTTKCINFSIFFNTHR